MPSLPKIATAALTTTLAASALRTPSRPEVSALPDSFRWGVALAGFQSEGHSPDSNWRRYSDQHAATITDQVGDSVDWIGHLDDDIARAEDLGVDTFRYSVEWARTETEPGRIDHEGFTFYDRVIDAVQDAGMAPMITLDHWVYPGWLADRGGWLADDVVQQWLTHAQRVVERYAGRGVTWITINEPGIYVDFERRNRRLSRDDVTLMKRRLVETHRKAYELIKHLDPGAQVSSNIAYLPAPLNLIDDRWFFNPCTDAMDFLGIDYYYGLSVDNPTVAFEPSGRLWKVRAQPDGLLHALRIYHRKAPHLPIWVVENGVCTKDGTPRGDGMTRSDHLLDHLYYLQRAVDEGIPVMGYNYWSLTDNYEWGSYRPRFGLYRVDVTTDLTKERHETDGVATYRAAIRRGGVPSGYRPKRREAWGSPAAPWFSTLGRLFR